MNYILKIGLSHLLSLNSVLFVLTCPSATAQMSKFSYQNPSSGYNKLPLNSPLDSVMIDVNRFKLPINNIGTLADQLTNGQRLAGGFYDGGLTLYSGGFYLSGISNGFLWANGNFSAERISDYVPGHVGTISQDPKNILYVIRSTDPPFGQSWQNWKDAVSQGAAFYDGNNDGIYNPIDLNANGKWDPDEDRPDFLGDITAWCVFNDGVPAAQRIYSDVNPQGIDIQQSVFAQKDSADLNNVIFVRYRIINRGTVAEVMDSVYFGPAYDVDIGDNGSGDLDGCDTLLNSAYTYHDPNYTTLKWGPNPPPAEFAELLQGPLSYIPGITFTDINANGIFDPGIDIPLDSAFNFRGPLLGQSIYPGAKNLNMSSANQLLKSPSPANRFQAWYCLTGKNNAGAHIDPCNWSLGQVMGGTNCANVNPLFLYSGDPVTQTGWVNINPRDQRSFLSSGPFKLEKDKPVDIIIANIVGRGSDALNSITVAKNYVSNIIKYYNSNFPNSILTGVKDEPNKVNNFRLDQNYPNPFNPSTKIRFSVNTNSLVTIKVYNILGKEVALLLNEQKYPGQYTLGFNAGKFNLSSGVYFYMLTAGTFTSVKKMVLLK